ncbi:MAG: phosphotransferase family protein, partial [Actinomycetota bacterium]
MAIPGQRDLDLTRKVLTEWLAARLPDATHLSLSELHAPGGTGFSNETFMFDADRSEGSAHRTEGLVLRIAPTGYQIFLEADFERQYRLLEVLDRESDVPVPPVRWFESDASLLGAPFFVMGKVDGDAAPDSPSYNTAGWLHDATQEERRAVWTAAMDALVRIHRVPTELVSFLAKPELGPTGLDQQLTYWERSLEWASQGRPQPTAEATWAWLAANVPSARPTALSWGDARIGNILFRDGRAAAVVDWEMLSLGGRQADLGWWLFLDAFHSFSAPRLAGLGTRQETIDLWEEQTGEHAGDLEWYEVFA